MSSQRPESAGGRRANPQNRPAAKSAPRARARPQRAALPAKVVGSGDYRLLGKLAAAGSRRGMFQKAGGLLDSAIVTGFGDYQITNPGEIPRFPSQAPKFGGDVVSETSFVANLVADGASSFALQPHAVNSLDTDGLSYALTPANVDLHLRGSQMARIYEEAAYRGLVFTFVPATSALNANGSIIMAVEYDGSRANYSSEADMRMALFSKSFKASDQVHFAVECNPTERPTQLIYLNSRGLRPGAVQDARFDCLGRLFIATVGLVGAGGVPLAAGTVLGQLYLSTSIEFVKPCLPSPTTAVFSSWTRALRINGVTDLLEFGVPPVLEDENTYPSGFAPAVDLVNAPTPTLTITWPAGVPSSSRYSVTLVTILSAELGVNFGEPLSVTMTNGLHYGGANAPVAPTTWVQSPAITSAAAVAIEAYEVMATGAGVMVMAIASLGNPWVAGALGTTYLRVSRLS